jgi:hypothetical protein
MVTLDPGCRVVMSGEESSRASSQNIKLAQTAFQVELVEVVEVLPFRTW